MFYACSSIYTVAGQSLLKNCLFFSSVYSLDNVLCLLVYLLCGRPGSTEKLFVFSSVYSLDDVLCLLIYLHCDRPEFTEKLFVFSSVYNLDDVLCLLVHLFPVAGQSLLRNCLFFQCIQFRRCLMPARLSLLCGRPEFTGAWRWRITIAGRKPEAHGHSGSPVKQWNR